MTKPKKDKAPKPATSPVVEDGGVVMRCAQRGCVVPTAHAKDKLCPVCNNPLNLISEPA